MSEYRNPLSKNITRTPNLTRSPSPSRVVTVGEVISVEYSGQFSGFITFRPEESEAAEVLQSVNSKSTSAVNNVAIPLFANLRIYPIVGEYVLLFSLGGNTYYIPINVLNNPFSNKVGTKGDSAKLNSNSKATFELPDDKKYYITHTNQGDIVLEGRFGQSIKFGGTVKKGDGAVTLYSKSDLSKNGDPILILRNGPSSPFEDIQNDDASIYMCSTQKIPIDTGKNGFEGITGTWSSLNVSGEVVEIEQVEVPSNSNSNSVESSRPGNPLPPDPEGQASYAASSTNASQPGYQQATPSGPIEVAPPSTGYLQPGNLTISAEGLKALVREEGSRNVVYDDKTGEQIASYNEARGYPTIGVGHLITNRERDRFSRYLKGVGTMTQEEIQKLLLEDLASRIRSLNNRLKAEVTQNMFDALLSMMFNTGEGNSFFKKAVSLTNQKKYQEAANMISSGPVTSKGKVFAGLVRRRKNESDTYIA